MPDLANIHIDVFLTNISVGYTNEMYNADDLFPVVPVEKRSNKYPIYNKDAFIRSSGVDAQGKPQSIRRPGALSTEVFFDLSNQAFYAEQLAKNYLLNDAEVALADSPIQPEIDSTMAVNEMIMLDNEIAVASKVMKRGNYATANKVQLVNGTTSWAAATGKPLSVDLVAAKKQVILGIIRAANTLALNYTSALTLSQNAEYVTRLQYVSKETVTETGLMPIVAGLKVIELRAQKVTSAEGLTGSSITNGYVWMDDQATAQNTALIYYKNPAKAGLRQVFFGLTFDAPDDSFGTHGLVVKRWREENRDSQRIEVRTTRDWRFTCTDGSTSGDNSNGFATGAYLISGTDL